MIDQRVAIVTGASQGIGAAIACRLTHHRVPAGPRVGTHP